MRFVKAAYRPLKFKKFADDVAKAPPPEASTRSLLFIAIFWSSITLAFDGFMVWSAWHQIQSTGFSKATGHVTQSTVEAYEDSEDGTTYSPKIIYRYRVDGKEYVSDRYRYLQAATGGGNARRIVRAFPVGREINVFYAPSDPSESVLQVGLEGIDYFMPLFMLPFNVIMVWLWTFALGKPYRRVFGVPAGGAKLIDDGFATRVRLSRSSPLMIAAAVGAGIAFVAIFLVGFTAGSNPPLRFIHVVWAVTFGGALIAYVASWIKILRNRDVLVIDEAGRHLTLPPTFGRDETLVVPFDRLLEIEVEWIPAKNSDGGNFAPTLIFSQGNDSKRREKLAEWWDQTSTNEFAAWLRDRLRLPGAVPAK